MPYFRVILSGKGIDYPFDGAASGVIGFFTTRVVSAPDLAQAQAFAKDLVLSEWLPGGTYASDNRGSIPALAIEESFQIGYLAGLLGRRPSGYSFYQRDD